MPASRSTLLSILGAVAAAFLLSGVAAAQVSLGPRVGPGVAEVRLVERNAEQLELDEKTIAAVQELAAEVSARDEKLNGQMREERLKLRDLLDEALPEETALMKQAAAVSSLAADMQKHQMQTSLRVRKLLTPEQRTELMELRKNVKQPRRRRQR
jgi:Spy/CpxP family protein refolding chaperone